jgi:predicted dehydrogenase
MRFRATRRGAADVASQGEEVSVGSYRVGVVGLTGIATAPSSSAPPVFGGVHPHAHVACYANHPHTDVVAICDLVPALFATFDRLWGDRWPNVARYTDYREMLARERLDLLSVVTPDHRHAEVVLAAVPAGVKGIYCEKPMATTLADADRMIAVTEHAGVAMVVNHTRRWYATYQYARDLIRAGHLGRVTHIHATCGGPRAMLFRNGTHLIDAVTFLAESEPIWVTGFLDAGQEHYGPVYAGDGGRDPARDPGGSAVIRYENGVIAFVFCSKPISKDTFLWEVIVYCEGGSLQITEPGGVEVMTMAGGGISGRPRCQVEVPQYRWTDGTAAIEELVASIEGRATETQSSPREARKTLAILLAILQSQHRGNVPIVAPFADAS